MKLKRNVGIIGGTSYIVGSVVGMEQTIHFMFLVSHVLSHNYWYVLVGSIIGTCMNCPILYYQLLVFGSTIESSMYSMVLYSC